MSLSIYFDWINSHPNPQKMTADRNFYDDRFDQTTDQLTYTPAAVNKSNSLTSNECTQSSFDCPTSANTIQPLKLVFKRQPDNKYQIKSHNKPLLDDNNNQLSNDAWSTASDLPVENDLTRDDKRRPMRQSARKVKFIFSDAEEDQEADFLPPTRKKKRSNKDKDNSLTSNNNNNQNFSTEQLLTPQLFSQYQKNLNEKDNSSDDDDENHTENSLKIYQELLLKNIPKAQMFSIQNMVLQNQLQNQSLLNAKMSVEQSLAAEEKRSRKQRRRVVHEIDTEAVKPKAIVRKKPKSKPKTNSRNINQKKPIVTPPPLAPPIKKFRQAPETTFTRDDIYKASFLEKHEIIKLKPYVALYHSQGIPIALVENKTNFIQTKAVLFLHLFVSLSAGCIWCPLCVNHLSITEFSRHVHPEEGDDEEEDLPAMETKAQKTYKVLPYRIDNSQELSSDVLVTWKAFAKRFSEFKQTHVDKLVTSAVVEKKQKEVSERSSQETKEPAKFQAEKVANKKMDSENSPPLSPPLSPQSMRNLEKFNDWDYEDDERFLITSDRIAGDQVYEVQTDRPQEEIHYFMEQQEDLLLSEDESDDKPESTEEGEAGFDHTKSLAQVMTIMNSPKLTTDYNNIEPLLNDMVTHVVDSFSFQKVKQQLRTKRLSYDESTVKMSCAKPPLLERYFNLYDNLTADVLLYICDNEFTVIPESYVLYINSKRAIVANELKLARSDHFQREWLQLSLDLECGSKTRRY